MRARALLCSAAFAVVRATAGDVMWACRHEIEAVSYTHLRAHETCRHEIEGCRESAACSFCFDVFEAPALPETDDMRVLMYSLDEAFRPGCDLGDERLVDLIGCVVRKM